MWNISRLACLLFILAHLGYAQNPADVSLTINSRNGQTTFRMGEAIPVEIRFKTSTSGKYQVTTDLSERVHLNGIRVYDQFTAEPAADAVDPLREQTRMFEL
jgi:metal-dependent HD superfamily phosphatase/phosphodiesterase